MDEEEKKNEETNVENQNQENPEEEKETSEEETKENLPLHTPIPPTSPKEQKETRYILFLVYNERAPVDRDDVFDLIDQLNKITTAPEETRIDMVILSNGGYPHPAYQMMNIVRSKCKKLKAVVPLFAKSAATLMTLASDEIIMGPQSEIGPLDMQMEHPLIENLHISALEGYYPFMQLYGKFVTDFFPLALKMAQDIAQAVPIKREDAVDIAMNTAMSYLVPIVQQINPTVVNMCYRALTTGEQYAYNFFTDTCSRINLKGKRGNPCFTKQHMHLYGTSKIMVRLSQGMMQNY
jgi:Periplasmic serine proteases (ClpP class)